MILLSDVIYDYPSMLAKRAPSFGYGKKLDISLEAYNHSETVSRPPQKHTASIHNSTKVLRRESRWATVASNANQFLLLTRAATLPLAAITPSKTLTKA